MTFEEGDFLSWGLGENAERISDAVVEREVRVWGLR